MGYWNRNLCHCGLTTCLITFFLPCVTSLLVSRKIGRVNAAFIATLLLVVPGVMYFVTRISFQIFASDSSTKERLEKAKSFDFSSALSMLELYFLAIWYIGSLIFALIVGYLRHTMREQRHIAGNACQDYTLGVFCTSCTLCQMYEHIKDEEKLFESREPAELDMERAERT